MLTLIANVTKSGLTGINGDLALRLPEDLKLFKALTFEKTVFVGPKTWVLVHKLPDRNWLKLERETFKSALSLAGSSASEFIVAGLFDQTINFADKMLLSVPHKEVVPEPTDCCCYFPKFSSLEWNLHEVQKYRTFDFQTWARRPFVNSRRFL